MSSPIDKIAPYYKAVTGVVVPFLTQIGAALLDTGAGGSAITAHEWVSAVVISLVAGGAVFSIPNKDPQALHQEESVQPPVGEPDVLDEYQAEHAATPEEGHDWPRQA